MEIKKRGGARAGSGRKRSGSSVKKTVSICASSEDLDMIKSIAALENKTVSRLVIDTIKDRYSGGNL